MPNYPKKSIAIIGLKAFLAFCGAVVVGRSVLKELRNAIVLPVDSDSKFHLGIVVRIVVGKFLKIQPLVLKII